LRSRWTAAGARRRALICENFISFSFNFLVVGWFHKHLYTRESVLKQNEIVS
jgi:hypothetical protein